MEEIHRECWPSEWKLLVVDSCDRNTPQSGVRSVMYGASQNQNWGTYVDDATPPYINQNPNDDDYDDVNILK